MNAKHILLPTSLLLTWLHGSPVVHAGVIGVGCDLPPPGSPCPDPDLNPWKQAACNAFGNCDQNAILLLGEPCPDTDAHAST
jgi:hypothetical protein